MNKINVSVDLNASCLLATRVDAMARFQNFGQTPLCASSNAFHVVKHSVVENPCKIAQNACGKKRTLTHKRIVPLNMFSTLVIMVIIVLAGVLFLLLSY